MIAPAKPGAWIGRGEQRVDLRPREERDLAPREALGGNGEHALNLRGMRGCLECRVPKERVKGGQSQIPTPSAHASRLLAVIQKRANQRGIYRLETESRRWRVQSRVRKFQEQAERIAIRRDGVRTDLAPAQQAIREEPFQ